MARLKIVLSVALAVTCSSVYADISGPLLGGGLGVGMQNMSYNGTEKFLGSPALHLFTGYQFADFIGVEAGYTYIGQASSPSSSIPAISTTVYDLAFVPGFTLPLTPVTIYGRFGVDTVSSNAGTNFASQLFSDGSTNFEFGVGAKVTIPFSRAIVRVEYVNYGSTFVNNYGGVKVSPSVLALNAAYVF